ncbi:platelet glycoprotein VI-like isoform X1 [Dendropsophus ebraccatus]|uniref:platelet glycoprotein VI-like isoform X1 n=1 Tax=Dendropsophus ebraccatus TaxID=150705 RepID=UPI003831E4EC
MARNSTIRSLPTIDKVYREEASPQHCWRIDTRGYHSAMKIHILLAGLLMGVLVSSSEDVPPPILRQSPDYPVYYEGETVTLTCETQGKYRRFHFSFYKNSKYIENDNTNMYKIYGMEYSDIGIYACDYWTGHHSSPRSNEVSLFFSDKLPSPAIHLEPSRSVYSMGESVTLVCSHPKNRGVRRIAFYKKGNIQPLKEGEENTYVISTSEKEIAGGYSCNYCLDVHGKLIPSPASGYITVNVSVLTSQATVTTIIQETLAPDKTSKTSSTETFSPTQNNKVTRSASHSKAQSLTYIFGGGLILIIVFVLVHIFFRIYVTRNGKKEGSVVELPAAESDLHSGHNLKNPVKPSLYPTEFQEMETEHYYSEITLPIVKGTPPIVTLYSTAKAIDPLPSVYQTNLTTPARK